jgi:lipoyltransferase 1
VKAGSYSYSTGLGTGAVKDTDTVKSVFISQSDDIFTNLALEDWLYRNFDFTNHHVLLLWKNSPAVVIGRHQNPWLEANTAILSEHGIEIARRNSGGGTVYHDHGNLNLTFFTPRKHYSRKNNLELICRALFREWGLKTEISPREDIVINESYKVSFLSNILI